MASRSFAAPLVALVVIASLACSAGAEGTCLRKTDCEAPYSCVDGTCRTDEVLGGPTTTGDGGASDQ